LKYIYIYIYIYREREREREWIYCEFKLTNVFRELNSKSISKNIYIFRLCIF
jgi:hypothetical protein